MTSNDAAAHVMKCPVCHEVYNTGENLPKVFGVCGHNVCAVCIPRCIRQGRATCPLCRQETPVPPNGLPTNYLSKDMIASSEAARILADVECSACHKNVPPSEGYACKTCSDEKMISVCAGCAIEAHWGHSVFKRDALLSREQIDAVTDQRRAYAAGFRQRVAATLAQAYTLGELALGTMDRACKNFDANPYVGEEFTFPSFLTKDAYGRRMSEASNRRDNLHRVFDDIERAIANCRQEVMRIRVDDPQSSTSQVRQAAASSGGKRVVDGSDSEDSDDESFRSRARSRKPACLKRRKDF